jgi:hypothetical protein
MRKLSDSSYILFWQNAGVTIVEICDFKEFFPHTHEGPFSAKKSFVSSAPPLLFFA